uniref:DUF3653 domain-containing protein n=1 Tax=Fulvimonas soli TaxID=155197 RepID=UPI000D6C07EB
MWPTNVARPSPGSSRPRSSAHSAIPGRLGDLGALHPAWQGWTLEPSGDLVSLNGYRFQPDRLAKWPIICEQARFW